VGIGRREGPEPFEGRVEVTPQAQRLMVSLRAMMGWALFLAVCFTLGLLSVATVGAAGSYFNSSEPGCSGSDPNVLLCEDFESKDALGLSPAGSGVGTWASENADVANSKGGIDTRTKGWAMRIRDGYPHSICGGVGVGGTNCAARSILQGGDGGNSAMADHSLAPGTGPGRGSSYNEIYVRFYWKPLAGYVWNNNQKMITWNPCCANDGGIVFGGSGRNDEWETCPFQSCNVLSEGYLTQNQGNKYSMRNHVGNWTFVELHVKLNTPGVRDGVFEMWLDDCGPAGLTFPSTPTLRARYTNVLWRPAGENRLLGVVFFDIWGNPSDVGTVLIDQLKVTKVGPIGFMGRRVPRRLSLPLHRALRYSSKPQVRPPALGGRNLFSTASTPRP